MKTYTLNLSPRKIDTSILEEKIDKINNSLEELKVKIAKDFTKTIDFSIKDKVISLNFEIDKIANQLNFLREIDFKENCEFNYKKIKKECFNYPHYFYKYIYYCIKNNSLPQIDTILAYGDYKVFNDVGVYFYNKTYLKKAEIFLNKAYILAKDKSIPAHNLSVLYATKGMYDIQKSIQYAKEANLSIDNYNLGIYYYIGLGVKEDNKKAKEYFKKAKDINFAQENLKLMEKFNIGK
jgi:hypothetical protein